MPTFEEIAVGSVVPVNIEQTVTQEMIDKWASVSVDYNPLHVDPEFARTTQFGGTIGHGTLTVTYLMEMLTRWLGRAWLNGGELRDLRFVAPVRSGDTVKTAGIVVDKRMDGSAQRIECDVWLERQDGVKAIVGKAIAAF